MLPVRSGVLLVATPAMTDPNFDRTVVYVVEHGAHGTLGVVLNRPSETDLLEVLPGWWSLAAAPRTFHIGGPCERDTALCLGVGHPPSGLPGVRPVATAVHLVDLDADPAVTGAGLDQLRVFAGYAGWGPDQLAAEIAADAWVVVAGAPADVVGESGTALWRAVLRRQGGSLAVLSAWTEDPSLN